MGRGRACAGWGGCLLAALLLSTCSNERTAVDVPGDWTRVEAGEFAFWLPPSLAEVPVRGIDSLVRRWESKDLVVQFDYGRYSDPLTSYAAQEAYRVTETRVGGERARIVSFDQEGGWSYTAIHFPQVGRDGEGRAIKLTMTVKAGPAVDPQWPLQIVHSVRF